MVGWAVFLNKTEVMGYWCMTFGHLRRSTGFCWLGNHLKVCFLRHATVCWQLKRTSGIHTRSLPWYNDTGWLGVKHPSYILTHTHFKTLYTRNFNFFLIPQSRWYTYMSFQIKQKYNICSCLCILTESDSKSFGSVQWAECKGLISPSSSVWKAECNGIAQVLPVPCGRHSTSLRWIFK